MFEIYLSIIVIYYVKFLWDIYKGISKDQIYTNDIKFYPFFTIIIPFRNEKDVILKTLNHIEQLNYPEDKFEVIFINDFSDDGSEILLQKNIKKSNIKVINSPSELKNLSFKKRAITYGIENSQGEIIITTDADCEFYPNWLLSYAKIFNDDKIGFVTGVVRFSYNDSLFTKLQALEFASLVITGGALINNNEPIMCNAANLAYKKNLFYEVGGYDGNNNISSGDDVYLMQKIAYQGKAKISFYYDDENVVTTYPTQTLKDFYNQRKRWASKNVYYPKKSIVFKLFMIFLFYFNLMLTFILGFINFKFWLYFLTIFIIKIIFEFVVLNKGINKFFPRDILLKRFFLLAEILHIPYIVFSAVGGVLGKYDWKGRKLKK